MSIKKILIKNDREFLADIKRVSECMVITNQSNAFLTVKKKQVLKESEIEKIHYYLTKEIYQVGREVMVIV